MIQKIKNRAFLIGQPYSISDLASPQFALSKIGDTKSKVNILIIDDDEFPYLNKFRDEGYQIKQLDAIPDLKLASEYPIVICDNKGVGLQYDTEKGGAYVIRELKKMYPFKQYALYSGNDYQVNLNSIFGDDVITISKTTTDEDSWRAYLNSLINRALDPKENWKKLRSYLLNNDVPLVEVLKLESAFVFSYKKGDNKRLKEFPSEDDFPNLTENIRSIIHDVIAGLLIKALFGI